MVRQAKGLYARLRMLEPDTRHVVYSVLADCLKPCIYAWLPHIHSEARYIYIYMCMVSLAVYTSIFTRRFLEGRSHTHVYTYALRSQRRLPSSTDVRFNMLTWRHYSKFAGRLETHQRQTSTFGRSVYRDRWYVLRACLSGMEGEVILC